MTNATRVGQITLKTKMSHVILSVAVLLLASTSSRATVMSLGQSWASLEIKGYSLQADGPLIEQSELISALTLFDVPLDGTKYDEDGEKIASGNAFADGIAEARVIWGGNEHNFENLGKIGTGLHVSSLAVGNATGAWSTYHSWFAIQGGIRIYSNDPVNYWVHVAVEYDWSVMAEGDNPEIEKSSGETLLSGDYQRVGLPLEDLIGDGFREFAFYPPGEEKFASGWNNGNPPKIESSFLLTTGNYIDLVMYSESRAIGRVVPEPGTFLLFALGLIFMGKNIRFQGSSLFKVFT